MSMSHPRTPPPNHPDPKSNNKSVQVLKSSPWTSDDLRQYCTSCHKQFNNFFKRRHHCRLCGDIFCNECSQQKALIPPSSIVLQPIGGKKRKSSDRRGPHHHGAASTPAPGMGLGVGAKENDPDHNPNPGYENINDVSFERDDDPDRTFTYAKTIVDTTTPPTTNINTNQQGFTSPSRSPASTFKTPPTPITANRAPRTFAIKNQCDVDNNHDHGYNDAIPNYNIPSDNSSCDRSLTSANNMDGMSFATIQIHKNNPNMEEINVQKNDDDEDDDYTFSSATVANDYEDDITRSMSGLQPPSASNLEADENHDEQGINAKSNTEALYNNNDDDLSVSVATSEGFSYVSTNGKPKTEQAKEDEKEQEQEDCPLLQQQQHNLYQDGTETPQRNPYERQISESSSASMMSCNTHNTNTTTTPSTSTILYGKGLEERMKLAREPLRVCVSCFNQLQSIQEQLRNHNSNAMKYNSIDPTNIRRLMNSPLAFTLGHEIRKAAYTLNNLLPMPRRMGMFMESSSRFSEMSGRGEMDCDAKDTCKGFIGNFGNVDGVRIPAKLLELAKGVAVMTCFKTGVGVAGVEFGTGLVISRLSNDNHWSPPCAIGTAGISWGALVGVQLSDHVFLLMTDKAVDMFVNNNNGSFQLGADIGVAAGPLGRSIEADVGAIDGDLTPIYTYSLSKGFYAGVSLDGKVIITRHNVNEKFYGRKIDAKTLLSGDIPSPPAAQPLYDALKRCHVYASSSSASRVLASVNNRRQQHYISNHPNFYSVGDAGLSAYDAEEEYNLTSRHFTPY